MEVLIWFGGRKTRECSMTVLSEYLRIVGVCVLKEN